MVTVAATQWLLLGFFFLLLRRPFGEDQCCYKCQLVQFI